MLVEEGGEIFQVNVAGFRRSFFPCLRNFLEHFVLVITTEMQHLSASLISVPFFTVNASNTKNLAW